MVKETDFDMVKGWRCYCDPEVFMEKCDGHWSTREPRRYLRQPLTCDASTVSSSVCLKGVEEWWDQSKGVPSRSPGAGVGVGVGVGAELGNTVESVVR